MLTATAPTAAAAATAPTLATPFPHQGSSHGRHGTKLSIVTTALAATVTGPSGGGGTGDGSHETAPLAPRTPRRESRDAPRNPARGRPGGKASIVTAHGAVPPALAVSAVGAGGCGGGSGGGSGGSSEGGPRARRWGVIQKAVLPNPAIRKVNEKVLQIITTLRKSSEDRTEADIKLLYSWLMNQEKLSSLFTTMSEVSAKKLCKDMEFLHLDSGAVVVNQGDRGNTCFILLSGMVSVFVRSPEEQAKYQRLVRSASMSDAPLAEGALPMGNKVVTLTPGATFGELCLIEPDSKRSATVIVDPAAQVANFIVLTAASYLRMTRSQTIEGTITDSISFLQHMLLFRKWTKMQLMHLVNSMKLVSFPAGQYITRKGSDADSFFVILRGDVHECVTLTQSEGESADLGYGHGTAPTASQSHSQKTHPSQSPSLATSQNLGQGNPRGTSVLHCLTIQLTFLAKFDVAGEYLAAEKKVVTCPMDLRAVTDVDCLVLSRKLFQMHFGGKDLKKHAARALRLLRTIATQRDTWRETRIHQALQYPTLRVPITRRLMRLSGNMCMICGRCTHVGGDELCMELATYHMEDEKRKKRSAEQHSRTLSRHRISVAPLAPIVVAASGRQAHQSELDALPEDEEEGDNDDDDEGEGDGEGEGERRRKEDVEEEKEGGERGEGGNQRARSGATRRRKRLGHRLLSRQWRAAERVGLKSPSRPGRVEATSTVTSTRAASPRSGITSITRTNHVSQRRERQQQQRGEEEGGEEAERSKRGQHGAARERSLEQEIQHIRAAWPYKWRELEWGSVGQGDGSQSSTTAGTREATLLPTFERLYRNAPRPKTEPSRSRTRPASMLTARPPPSPSPSRGGNQSAR